MPSLSKPIRRVITLALGLALLGALWTTALGSLSSEGSAVPMLTNAGTELLNPLLTANGNGVAQGAWNTIQQQAKAHPDQSVSLPGINIQVKGHEIAGMSFAQGTQVIYRQVAEGWYAHGISYVFNLPAPLQHAVSTYDPFVSKSLNVPGLPKVSLPQIPSFFAPLVTHLGLSPTTLTAAGHSTMLNLSRWFWIFSAALALALAVFSSGWHRLSNPSWSLFHASWHIALIGVVAWFLINHNKSAVAPYMGVVGPIGGAFFPIYGTAAVVGLAGIIGSVVAKRGIKLGAGIGRMASRREEAVPVAAPRRRVSQPPFQPDVASRAPFGRSPFDQQPGQRDLGGFGDAPAQGPSYGAPSAGQGWQRSRSRSHSRHSDPPSTTDPTADRATASRRNRNSARALAPGPVTSPLSRCGICRTRRPRTRHSRPPRFPARRTMRHAHAAPRVGPLIPRRNVMVAGRATGNGSRTAHNSNQRGRRTPTAIPAGGRGDTSHSSRCVAPSDILAWRGVAARPRDPLRLVGQTVL